MEVPAVAGPGRGPGPGPGPDLGPGSVTVTPTTTTVTTTTTGPSSGMVLGSTGALKMSTTTSSRGTMLRGRDKRPLLPGVCKRGRGLVS